MNTWVIVPAAGTGRRFDDPVPKQYHLLAGRPVIEHTLERILAVAPARVLVPLDREDARWRDLAVFRHSRVTPVAGGASRFESVLNAVQALAGEAGRDDWILVHDVARPCVRPEDIQQLQQTLQDDPVGGILGAPVTDTLKRVADHRQIQSTEDRSHLWAAMTPQMFRYALLAQALESAAVKGLTPTDEAMAVELLGSVPKIVSGHRDNIKITHREDLVIAEAILCFQRDTQTKNNEPDT